MIAHKGRGESKVPWISVMGRMRLCTLAQIHLTRWLVMLVGQATKSKP
jgi:hypothetical protein